MKKLIILFSTLIVIPFCSCNRDSSYGQAVIIFTNDVHGQIDGPLSYATVGRMKEELQQKGQNVLLLDSGDIISGGYYCDYDRGKSLVKAMSMAGYDAATLGNHEFDYEFTYLKELMDGASFPFISSNFYHMKDGVPTTRFTSLGHKIFKMKGINIGVFGLSTPDSVTTSTPAHFQDPSGKYIYTFFNEYIYDKAQEEIDLIRDECDIVVCMSHLGDENQSANYTATKLANKTTGIDLILDGHTHKEVTKKVVKAKDGKDVVITQTGSKFHKIGVATVSKRKNIDIQLIFNFLKFNYEIRQFEHLIIDELDKRYSKVIAKSDINFTRGDAKREDNMGDLVAEAYYYYYNSLVDTDLYCDFAIVNSGGVRANVNAGTWSIKTTKLVLSFSNVLCLKDFPRSTIKTALEFSSYKMPKEYFGGQQQTCGLRYKVRKDVVSDIKVNAKGAYESGPSKEHEKVYDIEVYDRATKQYLPFDAKETYRVASIAYVINDCGDGMSMFSGGDLIRLETEMCDFKALTYYVSRFDKNGEDLPVIASSNSPLTKDKFVNLGINYTDPNLAGRITII